MNGYQALGKPNVAVLIEFGLRFAGLGLSLWPCMQVSRRMIYVAPMLVKVSLRCILLLAGSAFLAVSCKTPDAEPGVPSATASGDGAIIRVPARADGTLDTVGMPQIRFSTLTLDANRALTYDFGTVDEGAVITQRFPFRNAGAEPLLISAASSSCGCTVPQVPREPIAPGDTASIFVRFDTQDKAGPQDKVVTLVANTYPNTTAIHLVGIVDTLR